MPFCRTPLWDSQLTWFTSYPQLTECFQATVLVYFPVIVLIAFLPLDIYNCLTSKSREIPWSVRIIVRLFLTVTASVLAVLQLIFSDFSAEPVFASDVVGPVVSFLAYVTLVILLAASKHCGQVYSPTQFMFWSTAAICQALTIASLAISGYQDMSTTKSILLIVNCIISLIMLFLNCLADDQPLYADLMEQVDDNPCPKRSASFPSRILFVWFDDLIRQGWRKPLLNSDLWSLNPEDTLAEIVPPFERKLEPREAEGGHANISVLLPLIQVYWPQFLWLTGLYILKTLFSLANPQLINLFILFIEEDQEIWKGYLYMVLFGLVSMSIALFDTLYWSQVQILSMRAYSTLAAVIYKKSLKLSAQSRNDNATGKILNLIVVDADKVKEAMTFIIFLWASPIHVGLTMYFIWQIIGPSVLVGLAILVLCLPLNAINFYYMEKLQKKQMKHKDMRVKLLNEILSGIKVLKMYAWEKSFIQKIGDIRKIEVNALKWVQYLDSLMFLIWNSAPFLVAIGSFLTYVLIDPENNVLNAQTAFVSLSLFNTLQAPFFLIPYSVVGVVQGYVAIKRINNFLNSPALDPNNVTTDNFEAAVVAKNAYFTWGSKGDVPFLKNLNFVIKKGSLTAIVGKVGSGKSSLLSALLGEMQRTNGFINVGESVGYVSQQAWIRNMSLKKNILFGKNLNERTYDQVLADGDRTEIGEKGINLSGGQKQRVNLARAVYANREIYYLDDPLSAVDSHVGKHIFQQVIGPKGVLAKKTRLLVTHSINYLPQMDNIIVMKNGSISEIGSYDELLKNKGDFAEFLIEQLENETEDKEAAQVGNDEVWRKLEDALGSNTLLLKRQQSKNSGKSVGEKIRTTSIGELSEVSASSRGEMEHLLSKSEATQPGQKNTEIGTLVEKEHVEVTGVAFSTYIYYVKSMGISIFFMAMLAMFLFQAFSVSMNLTLTNLSNDPAAVNDTSVRDQYLIMYGVFGGLQSIFIFLAILIITTGSIRASVRLHSKLLVNILNAPMSFFDTSPLGRILNRFSKDMDDVDNVLQFFLKDLLNQTFIMLGVVFILVFVYPLILTLVLVLFLIFLLIRAAYLRTGRQLKRLMAINRSPMNSHLEESLSGASTIRAFQFQREFIEENDEKVEGYMKSWYPEIIGASWLFWRLQLIGAILTVVTSLIIILNRESFNSGVVGLCLSYTVNCQVSIYWLTRVSADVEKAVVSVERIKEYQEVEQENDITLGRRENFETGWPGNGEISLEQYSTRYRPGLDLVLTGVTASIQPGEKIGIVGRTGAGKSSVTLALFRIIEAAGGSINIDGVNIAGVPLTKLRSSITIIPQDPVIFSGSLRSNLDPFGQYSDQEVWRALKMSHLSDMVQKLTAGLEHEIAEGGGNLSVGQRQLVCLARAILRKTKILVLDEATAAVDLETDDLIQVTIREEFSDCTVITIAHRIKTILDNDRVLVMDNGNIKEFDQPSALLKDKESAFYKMSQDAGIVS